MCSSLCFQRRSQWGIMGVCRLLQKQLQKKLQQSTHTHDHPLASSCRTMMNAYLKQGTAPPCNSGCDVFLLGRQLWIVCNSTQWNTQKTQSHCWGSVCDFWAFIVCCGVQVKEVYQAGAFIPTVATCLVALPLHSVCSEWSRWECCLLYPLLEGFSAWCWGWEAEYFHAWKG